MQPKKSPRKAFSCMPTRPVAGEALNLHLSQPARGGKQGNGQVFSVSWAFYQQRCIAILPFTAEILSSETVRTMPTWM